MKNISSIHRGSEPHWVGDGFPVHTVFSYSETGKELTPFLLLDHAGPANFEPTDKERGVGWHPHRGFETVSIAFEGAVDHEDSAGNSGSIGPGDVQWMTAGAGVLHKETHGREFARRGGPFEMLQLWVNLPAKSKMAAPGYQTLLAKDIPAVDLPNGAGTVRVIAGQFGEAKGTGENVHPDQSARRSLARGRSRSAESARRLQRSAVRVKGKDSGQRCRVGAAGRTRRLRARRRRDRYRGHDGCDSVRDERPADR